MAEVEPFSDLSGSALTQANAMKEGLAWFGTQFGDFSTVNRNTLVDVASHYPLSDQANIYSTTDASVTSTATEAEVHLQTTATTNAEANLQTAEIGRYTAGFVAEAGIGMRMPSLPTGEQTARWGYFDNGDGVYFGADSDGIFVNREVDGVAHKTYQTDWNVDTMTGSPSDEDNPSGITLDVSDGNIYRIVFAWYGYGEIRFEVLASDDDGRQEPIPVHRETFNGEASLKNPNLPVSAEVENNSTAETLDMYVGGRQYAIYGDTNSNRRIKSEQRIEQSLNGTTWTPLITIQRKTAFNDVKIEFLSFDVLPSDNLIVQVREDSDLTGASFGTPTDTSASETAVQSDTSATAIDVGTGRQRYKQLISSGGGANQQVGGRENIELRLRREDTLTLLGRKVTGTGGTVTSVIRWKEQW